MTIQEKMHRYIERTGRKFPAAYHMSTPEMMDLYAMAVKASMDALCLAFEYGRAKGVRAAQNRAAK